MRTWKYNLCDVAPWRPKGRKKIGAIFIGRQGVETVKHLGAEIGVRDVKVIAKPAVGFLFGDAHGAYSIENSNRVDALNIDIVSGFERGNRLT